MEKVAMGQVCLGERPRARSLGASVAGKVDDSVEQQAGKEERAGHFQGNSGSVETGCGVTVLGEGLARRG